MSKPIVAFFEWTDTDNDHGYWYRLEDPESQCGTAVMLYPRYEDDHDIVPPSDTRWRREEYTEDELPDWLCVELAKRALTEGEN